MSRFLRLCSSLLDAFCVETWIWRGHSAVLLLALVPDDRIPSSKGLSSSDAVLSSSSSCLTSPTVPLSCYLSHCCLTEEKKKDTWEICPTSQGTQAINFSLKSRSLVACIWRKLSTLRPRVNHCSACLLRLEAKNIFAFLSADLKLTCQLSLHFSSSIWGTERLRKIKLDL